MPNWVFNSVDVSGDKVSLEKLQAQLNSPVTKDFVESEFNQETKQWTQTKSTQVFSNPVFSFWNVIAPTDLVSYYGAETHKIDSDNFMNSFNESLSKDDSWYWWNLRNWGTKWDIAKDDRAQFSETQLEVDDDGSLMYHFQTAWSPVPEIFQKLSEQYPTLEFQYEFEEEQGWGGEMIWRGGELTFESSYEMPESHADYVERDKEYSCICSYDENPNDYFEDCPIDKEKYEYVGMAWHLKEGAEV